MTHAQVKLHNGTPTLFIDGQPRFAGIMWGSGPSPDSYRLAPVTRRYAEAGIHLFTFDVGSFGSPAEWRPPQPGQSGLWDFSTVEARFNRVLDADPDAYFHLRVHQEMPEWWRALYPDECELGSDGTRWAQSFASIVWREQAKSFLRDYAAFLDKVGLGERVIAYQTGAGATGEWVKGDCAMKQRTGDYSEPMRVHWRSWLRARYGDDVALRSAWNDANVTLDTAEVPTEAEQHHTTAGTFRDPRREGKVIDYYTMLSALCADLIIDFNRTVKEATHGKALAGAFYGYLLELAWNSSFFGDGMASDVSTYQRSGHLGLSKVLRSPHTDFIVSPYSYGFRAIGGEGSPMPPTESARLHNKLYIFEEDSRSHLAPPDIHYGQVSTLAESVAVLQRNLAECLTRGLGIWWLGETAHIDPEREPAFRPLLQRFQQVGTFALDLDRRPASEIAVVLDDESFYYETIKNDLDLPLIFQQRLWGLPRLGAPTDYFLLDDVLEGGVGPRKLFVFLNAFRLDRTRRDALAARLRRDGQTAVWCYGAGFIDTEPSLENMADLTGFRFASGEHPWGPLMHILDFTHPITQGLPQDLFWGTNARLAPGFHLEDPAATVLGQIVYSQGRCKPGFAVKDFGGWRSIYLGAPNTPAPVWRGIARYAGVHIYNDEGDVLYTTPQLLGVHTAAGGPRTFRLPRRAEVVYDLFNAHRVACDAAQFTVDLPPASTALYYTGEAALLGQLGGER